MHAVLHVIAALEEVDGRVFLLGLRLALRLKLRRPVLLGGSVGRHGKRAGQQAGRNNGDDRFRGQSSSRARKQCAKRDGVPQWSADNLFRKVLFARPDRSAVRCFIQSFEAYCLLGWPTIFIGVRTMFVPSS